MMSEPNNIPDPDMDEFHRALVEDDMPLQPVVKPDHIPEPKAPLPFFNWYTRFIGLLGIVAALTALSISAVMFAGFAENDTGIIHLLSAFVMCFGMGSLAYVPALITTRMTRQPLQKHTSLWLTGLMLPWLALGGVLMRLENFWRLAGLLAIITALLIIIWALMAYRRSDIAEKQYETDELQSED